MISGDNDLVPMRQLPRPRVEIDDLSLAFGKICEVARVNQQITVWHLDVSVKPMRIA